MRTAVTVICVSPYFVYPHTPITCFPCISTVSRQVAKDKQPMKGYDQQSNFKGTLFFLHLTNHSPNMKKNIERMLTRRGAQISLFLHNGVTHILTGSMNYIMTQICLTNQILKLKRSFHSAHVPHR